MFEEDFNYESQIKTARTILAELEYFSKSSKSKCADNVELRGFRTAVQTELAVIERAGRESPNRRHQVLVSSNIYFFNAVWSIAKQCTGVTSFRRKGSKQTMYDVESEGGLQWIKVSTMTESRLQRDITKHSQGWFWYESDQKSNENGEDVDMSGYDSDEADDEPSTSLWKMANQLYLSAQRVRVRYRHPKVGIVLTRVRQGAYQDIDALLERICAQGITVVTADQISDAPPIEQAVKSMVWDESMIFTDTLNIDCTILLAFASDISNCRVQEQPWFNKYIQKQIEIEEKEQLLPTQLWPAIGSRRLVCTHEAFTRMKEIIETIGTETEKVRTSILFDNHRSCPELIAAFQQLSSHSIPLDWQLPVQVVDCIPSNDPRLPTIAQQVAPCLSQLNQSVFLYGWATGLTTLSSNKAAVKDIEHAIEQHRTSDVEYGPNVSCNWPARSLVAKEKGRREQ